MQGLQTIPQSSQSNPGLSIPPTSSHEVDNARGELGKLKSFNKLGYSDASGPSPGTRHRNRALPVIKTKHEQLLEQRFDRIGEFTSWEGPVLPDQEPSFQKRFSELKGCLLELERNAEEMHEMLVNEGVTAEILQLKVEVKRVMEEKNKIEQRFRANLEECHHRSISGGSASTGLDQPGRNRRLELREQRESDKARKSYSDHADELENQLEVEEEERNLQEETQRETEEMQRKALEVQRQALQRQEETRRKNKLFENKRKVKELREQGQMVAIESAIKVYDDEDNLLSSFAADQERNLGDLRRTPPEQNRLGSPLNLHPSQNNQLPPVNEARADQGVRGGPVGSSQALPLDR